MINIWCELPLCSFVAAIFLLACGESTSSLPLRSRAYACEWVDNVSFFATLVRSSSQLPNADEGQTARRGK